MTSTDCRIQFKTPRNLRRGAARFKVILSLLVVIGLVFIGGVLAYFWPALQSAIIASRVQQSANNLKEIGLALHNYHDYNGGFPPAFIADNDGNLMHSWRVLILPYLDEQAKEIHRKYDFGKPWDHPHNRDVTRTMPAAYASPLLSSQAEQGQTSYLAIVGDRCVFHERRMRNFREISDGGPGTIMLIEDTTEPRHWAEPVDISPEKLLANYERIMDNPQGGINVLSADGAGSFIPVGLPMETFEAGIYINDGFELLRK